MIGVDQVVADINDVPGVGVEVIALPYGNERQLIATIRTTLANVEPPSTWATPLRADTTPGTSGRKESSDA
jgi:hypothetical protein